MRRTFSVAIDVPQDAVFSYVSDLTRHGEWSGAPLAIEPLTPGPVRAGSRYRSKGETRGREVVSEIEVTEYEPPARFAFVATSPSTTFRHQFSLRPAQAGTLVERVLTRTRAVLKVRLVGLYLVPFVLAPAARQAMTRLKERLEEQGSTP